MYVYAAAPSGQHCFESGLLTSSPVDKQVDYGTAEYLLLHILPHK